MTSAYRAKVSGPRGIALSVVHQAILDAKSTDYEQRRYAMQFLQSDDCEIWLDLATGAMGIDLDTPVALAALVDSLTSTNAPIPEPDQRYLPGF